MMDADARESMQLCTVIGDTELEHQTQSVADTARPALDGAERPAARPAQPEIGSEASGLLDIRSGSLVLVYPGSGTGVKFYLLFSYYYYCLSLNIQRPIRDMSDDARAVERSSVRPIVVYCRCPTQRARKARFERPWRYSIGGFG